MPRLTLISSTAPAVVRPRLPVVRLLLLGMATLHLLLAMLIHGPLRGIRLGLGSR